MPISESSLRSNKWKVFHAKDRDALVKVLRQWMNSRAYYARPGEFVATTVSDSGLIITNLPERVMRDMARDAACARGSLSLYSTNGQDHWSLDELRVEVYQP